MAVALRRASFLGAGRAPLARIAVDALGHEGMGRIEHPLHGRIAVALFAALDERFANSR